MAYLGRDAPYAERLLFEVPQGGTEDLDGSKALERCSSRWRAGARTRSSAARKRPIVAPGLTHGVQVGVATSPRDSDPASVAAVPLSAARLGVI